MAIIRAHEASSSTSPPPYYHVFMSFRGKDTRKTFTDHLYTALVEAGLSVFKDNDEIERGGNLKWELDKAIKCSQISIIVFSKDYASSEWCLDELVMILDCKDTSQHTAFPVFYDVEPSEVRNQKGSFEGAFSRYEEQLIDAGSDTETGKELMKKVQGWRAALRRAADLAGMELRNEVDG